MNVRASRVTFSIPHPTPIEASLSAPEMVRKTNKWTVTAILVFADACAFAAAVLCAVLCASFISYSLFGLPFLALEPAAFVQQVSTLAGICVGIAVWFAASGHYIERRLLRLDLYEVICGAFFGLLITGFVEFAGKLTFSRLWTLIAWTMVCFLVPLGRIAARRALRRFRLWAQDVIIFGSGAHLGVVRRSLSHDKYLGYRVVRERPIAFNASRSTTQADLDNEFARSRASAAVLIPSENEIPFLDTVIDYLNVRLIPYKVVPPISKLPLAGLSTQSFITADAVLLTVRVGLSSTVNRAVKRLFDIAASSVLVILLAPFWLFVAAAIAIEGRSFSSVLFEHERIGHRGRTFKCLKFRTMVPNAMAVLQQLLERDSQALCEWNSTRKLRNDPRRTKFGCFLRAASIDEWPQLINVLRGEMSLVGPRPVVRDELVEHYKDDHSYYLMVKPGITGLWQVSGRNDIGYADRVHLDSWYVRNWTLWNDVIILASTIPAVIKRTGAC
jgi:UDP-galactose-lipid carrier transferase